MADSHIKNDRYTKEEDEIIKKHYPNGGWEKVKELLPHRNKVSIYNRVNKLNVKYLTYNKDYFENINNENKAYWLGFISADGYVSKDGRFGIELAISDKNQLNKLIKDMDSNLKIKERIRNSNFNGKEIKSCYITIKNKKLHDDLVGNGVVHNKTELLKFPKKLSDELLRHYIRGYFDGDGTIVFQKTKRIRKDRNNKVYDYVTKEVSLVSNCIDFIEDLKCHLENVLNVELKIYESKNLYYIRFMSKDNILKILHYLYDDCNVYLDRKYQKSLELKGYCLS